MGKITFNGKDITKPFDYNGKKVVSLTYNGKVCTLKPAFDPCAIEHTFPNGFGYTGTWPAGQQALLNQCKASTTGSGITELKNLNGVTALLLPWADFTFATQENPDLLCIQAPNFINTAKTDYLFIANPKLQSLSIPALKYTGDRMVYGSPPSSINAPNIVEIGESGISGTLLTEVSFPKLVSIDSSGLSYSSKLERIDLPALTTFQQNSFSGNFGDSSPLHYINLPSLNTYNKQPGSSPVFQGIINQVSTQVILPSKFNTDDDKNILFGAGHWDRIKFTWV